ncbi:hypothetical protein WKH31_06625 [Metabacillus indicus]|uniref:hypothetical protein n=1 Tax=Metabacillus indicus TaxID=246786 RepID=UPI0031820A57
MMALNRRIRTLKISRKRFDGTESQDKNPQEQPGAYLVALKARIRTLKISRKRFGGTEPEDKNPQNQA